jgi:hypothetical protein
MKNAGDTRFRQWPSLTMHQPVKAFFDSEDFPAEANGCFDGRADNGIQRRTVSTACQYADSHNGNIFVEAKAFLKIFE